MNKYNFYISYCRTDGRHIAAELSKQLNEKGYSVFIDIESITGGNNFAQSILDAISNCDYFIPIVTEGTSKSAWVKKEIVTAFSKAKSRATQIIPIVATEHIDDYLQLCLTGSHQIQFNQNLGVSVSVNEVVEQIDRFVGYKLNSSLLYEKLSEYKKLKNHNKEAETICKLINLMRADIKKKAKYSHAWINRYFDLLELYEQLSKYVGGYDEESRKVVHVILNELDKTFNEFNDVSITRQSVADAKNHDFVIFVSIVIRLIYFDREIRSECADIITSGDVRNPCPVNLYIEKQKAYVDLFYQTRDSVAEGFGRQFVEETPKYIFENIAIGTTTYQTPHKNRPEQTHWSKSDEILISVAKFMQEGNKLFDVFQRNGIAGDFLECLRESYERLKNYCVVVGAADVAAECAERIVEIRNKAGKQQSGAPENEKAEKGIKSLLGFTLEGSGKYDVFISFKSEDSDLAERIYEYCHKRIKQPFWSKKSLPRLSKSEYSKAIDMALENSKHFIVVLSDLKYLDAEWIKYEMDVFNNEIKEGRKKDSNFLIVATDDVYNTIIKSNKTVLDIAYRRYQIIKMSEYEETLAQYIS